MWEARENPQEIWLLLDNPQHLSGITGWKWQLFSAATAVPCDLLKTTWVITWLQREESRLFINLQTVMLSSITQSNLDRGDSSASGRQLKPVNFLHILGRCFLNIIAIVWPSVQVPFSILVSFNLFSKYAQHLLVVPACLHYLIRKFVTWGLERFKYIEIGEHRKKQVPDKSLQAKSKLTVSICYTWQLARSNYSFFS